MSGGAVPSFPVGLELELLLDVAEIEEPELDEELDDPEEEGLEPEPEPPFEVPLPELPLPPFELPELPWPELPPLLGSVGPPSSLSEPPLLLTVVF
jgi:hypothetical protein